MDSHIKGKAVGGYGAIPGQRGFQLMWNAKAGDYDLVKTIASTDTEPTVVEMICSQKTAFDGTGAVTELRSQNLDGSGDVKELDQTNSGQTWKVVVIGADRRYYVHFVAGTTPTAGEIYFFARIAGKGPVS
jgi:hypothetical protein